MHSPTQPLMHHHFKAMQRSMKALFQRHPDALLQLQVHPSLLENLHWLPASAEFEE